MSKIVIKAVSIVDDMASELINGMQLSAAGYDLEDLDPTDYRMQYALEREAAIEVLNLHGVNVFQSEQLITQVIKLHRDLAEAQATVYEGLDPRSSLWPQGPMSPKKSRGPIEFKR